MNGDVRETKHPNCSDPFSDLFAPLRHAGSTGSRCAATPADGGPVQFEVLHIPELDAGFRLLYELKTADARAQFETWQKSHPEDPLWKRSWPPCARRRQMWPRTQLSELVAEFPENTLFAGERAKLNALNRGRSAQN